MDHTATRPNREVANPSNTLYPRSIALPSAHLLPTCHTLQSTLTWLNFRWPPPPPQLHAKMAAEQAHAETSFMSAAPPCVRYCHVCLRKSDSKHRTSTSAPQSPAAVVWTSCRQPTPPLHLPRQGHARAAAEVRVLLRLRCRTPPTCCVSPAHRPSRRPQAGTAVHTQHTRHRHAGR